MKYVKYVMLLLLIAFSAIASADIESVKIGPRDMLVTGYGFGNVTRATLARKALIVVPVSKTQIVLSSKSGNFPVGTQRLRIFKKSGQKFVTDITITGFESSGQPPLPPESRPQPAG